MTEPIFIAQTGEAGHLITVDSCRDWFGAMTFIGNEKGATFFRYSIDSVEKPLLALIEGWSIEPKEQGGIRWFLINGNQSPICHGATPDCYTGVDVRMCNCERKEK